MESVKKFNYKSALFLALLLATAVIAATLIVTANWDALTGGSDLGANAIETVEETESITEEQQEIVDELGEVLDEVEELVEDQTEPEVQEPEDPAANPAP